MDKVSAEEYARQVAAMWKELTDDKELMAAISVESQELAEQLKINAFEKAREHGQPV